MKLQVEYTPGLWAEVHVWQEDGLWHAKHIYGHLAEYHVRAATLPTAIYAISFIYAPEEMPNLDIPEMVGDGVFTAANVAEGVFYAEYDHFNEDEEVWESLVDCYHIASNSSVQAINVERALEEIIAVAKL